MKRRNIPKTTKRSESPGKQKFLSPEQMVMKYIAAYTKWVHDCNYLSKLENQGRIDPTASAKKMFAARNELQKAFCTSITPQSYGLSFPVIPSPARRVPQKIIDMKQEGRNIVIVCTKVLIRAYRYAACPYHLYKLKKTAKGWRVHELSGFLGKTQELHWRRPS